MNNQFINIVHNPRFSLWPFGETGFVNTGACAGRWKIERTNANDLLTVSKGTNANTTKYDKWLRDSPNMTIAITGLDANTTLKIRQFQEGAEDFGASMVAMTVIASGPAGEEFYFGVGENYAKLRTLGNDSNGDPIMVTKTQFFAFDDPIYEYMRITPFESPSAIGTYRLHHVQAEVLIDPLKISDMEIRPDWAEWALIRRYITPIADGMTATGASTTTIRIPIQAPPGGWRVTPTLAVAGQAPTFKFNLMSAGTSLSSVVPVYSLSTTVPASKYGCAVQVAGLTSVASASSYMLADNIVPVAYLNADYF